MTGSTDTSEPRSATPPPRPRWVKVLLLVIGLVALVLVALKVAGVEHGPSQHRSLAPAASVGLSIPQASVPS